MNWRDHLSVHPAAELFPLMSEAELRELAENIKANGLHVLPVGWARDGEFLLDGRNRLDAMALLGLLYETDDHHVGVKKWTGKQWSDRPGGRIYFSQNIYDGDPYEIALSLNVHRRHLTAQQKRELIAKVLKAKPEWSNAQIAKQTGRDDKTVAKVRQELEATSEIPRLEKTVGADGKARPVKAKKKSISTTVAKSASVVTVPTQAGTLDSEIKREWREAIRAFETLTSHTPAQVATAIASEDAPLVAEIANYFAKLVELICPTGNGEAPGSDSIPDDLSIPAYLQRGAGS